LENQVHTEKMDVMDLRDHKEREVQLVHTDQKDQLEMKVSQECRELQDK